VRLVVAFPHSGVKLPVAGSLMRFAFFSSERRALVSAIVIFAVPEPANRFAPWAARTGRVARASRAQVVPAAAAATGRTSSMHVTAPTANAAIAQTRTRSGINLLKAKQARELRRSRCRGGQPKTRHGFQKRITPVRAGSLVTSCPGSHRTRGMVLSPTESTDWPNGGGE
jgi:hypothetical protein